MARPTLQHLVDSKTFPAAELFVGNVSIMDDFGDYFDFRVPDAEVLLQGFKRAIITSMPEAIGMEHVERHAIFR